MAEKIVMIALSPTMEDGLIAKWNRKEGEHIESGDLLCEVETDKATMDYESIVDGVLLKIVVAEGGKANIGELIAIIGDENEDISQLLSELPSQSSPIVKNKTDNTSADKGLANVSLDKPNLTHNKSSPLARKLAEEKGIDINMLSGSGPDGRVIKRDIEKALRDVVQANVGLESISTSHLNQEDKLIPVSQKRKIIAQRLSESKFSAPHYYLKLKIRMDKVLSARKELNSRAKDKVSLNAFLIKFTGETLRRHPMVNAFWEKENIRIHGQVDIGLAVAQKDGLITPVVRDCANKGIMQIDGELKVLIDKAKNNKLMPEEYSHSTFTISSLGAFGIEEFTAVINPPGSAILAVGSIQKMPVVVENNEIKIQSMMTVTLSCDHRVIDGAVGANFLYELKKIMEDPINALY